MMALISKGRGGAYVQRWERMGYGSYSYIYIILLMFIQHESKFPVFLISIPT